HGYLKARRHGDHSLSFIGEQVQNALSGSIAGRDPLTNPLVSLLRIPPTRGNQCRLLTTGTQTFERIFSRIKEAQQYICVQYYILSDDHLGQELTDHLCEKASSGVAVYLLYDEIGSHGISSQFLKKLTRAGVRVSRFNPLQLRNRFQLNFRNHRKLVICDGQYAFVGGYNVDEVYVTTDDIRDTHVEISGPSVLAFQLAFTEDWYWATQSVPAIQWQPPKAEGTSNVMTIPTGPADDAESASLFFTHLIHKARQRCWLVSPYFVPDQSLVAAMQLAGLRGVDIRILIPENGDSHLVQHAMGAFVEPLTRCNVQFFSYQKGFLHQKVILVDDEWAYIGSSNLDNRSLRINFELGALIQDKQFAAETAAMLQEDFDNAVPTRLSTHWWQVFLTRVSRLLAPVL
ncbi:MAG: cardiolipin synthase, partial [Oceanospirillaceae bacterium]|nr:cardiolipin synthase [Oceanospirillaceae bacterium]